MEIPRSAHWRGGDQFSTSLNWSRSMSPIGVASVEPSSSSEAATRLSILHGRTGSAPARPPTSRGLPYGELRIVKRRDFPFRDPSTGDD
jgi:hypothetical protein